MKNKKQQNISLIIGLSIPVAMILFIGLAINGPRWFNTIAPPQYDFLYTTGQQNPYATYLVRDGRLRLQDKPVADGATPVRQLPLRFFLHQVADNSNQELSADEAMSLALDGSLRSPDGFSVETGRHGGGLIFGYRPDYRHRYLVKESYSEKIDLEIQYTNYSYYWNFELLGWVTSDE